MSDANKVLAGRWFELQGSQDLDRIDEVLDKTYVWHGPGGVTVKGQDGMREMLGTYFTAFPDLRFTIEDQLADGDKVITRWTVRGTQNGAFEGIAPTGKSITMTGISIVRAEGGKLVEEWENFDELGMMRKIGTVPPA